LGHFSKKNRSLFEIFWKFFSQLIDDGGSISTIHPTTKHYFKSLLKMFLVTKWGDQKNLV
jgi:hypothetical protein